MFTNKQITLYEANHVNISAVGIQSPKSSNQL